MDEKDSRFRNDTEESYLFQALGVLRDSYEQSAKPYIDRLVRIKSMEMPSITVSIDQAAQFKDITMSPAEYQAQWQASKNAECRAMMDCIATGTGTLKRHWNASENAVVTERLEPETPAPPKTCQHCKHWKAQYKTSPPTIRCENDSVFDMLDSWGGGGASFNPPADFGCNKWEVKE